MNTITKLVGGAVITVAALAMQPAQAHADTLGNVAQSVCEEIAENPTPQHFNAIVDGLLEANEESKEHDIMYYAMHIVCPQYLPLAQQALDMKLKGLQQTTSIVPGTVV